MFDKNNSFETALPCRPWICLSTTLRINLPSVIYRLSFGANQSFVSIFHVT